MKSFAALAAFIAAARAASLGNSNFAVVAGQPFTFNWYDAKGPVVLELRNGPSGNLAPVQTITSGATSDDKGAGSYTWAVPTTFPSAGPYAIVITDSTGPNYSSQFEIQGALVSGTTTTASTGTVSTATASTGTGSTSTDSTATALTTTTLASTTNSVTTLSNPTVTSTATTVTNSLAPDQTSSSFTFVSQTSSSVPVPTSAGTSSVAPSTSTLVKTTSTFTKPTSIPSTIPARPDGESNAAGIASPLALVLVSVAALFYLQ